MKRFGLLMFFLLGSYLMKAQQVFPVYVDTVNQDNEEDYAVQLNEVVIWDKIQWSNDTLRYRYNQMKHYIKQILPLAIQAKEMFYEIEEKTAGMGSGDRRRYIRTREKEIKANFSDKLKDLNVTQGKYLVMAINRELGMNCYQIVKELRNPITAAYYRTWASFNGIPLDKDYNAEENPDFERIMVKLGY